MIKPFKGEYPLTQGFDDPCCRANYFKYGLKGHNGLDYGLPENTQVIAAHSGRVTENAFDQYGYGNYIKIENDTEASIYAHLNRSLVAVGEYVQEGMIIGYSGTTGNSSGYHLHWGYYRNPRNRNNGFNGYIDPIPYFSESVIIPTTDMTDEQQRVFKFIEENKGTETNLESVVRSWAGAYNDLSKEQAAFSKTLEEHNTQIEDLKKQLLECQQRPLNPPNSSDLSVNELLQLLIKKIFNK